MGKVFAFVNMKGGVGKTTAAVMTAETLARHGKTVLLVDLDAQASASYAIAGFDGLVAANAEKRNLCGYLSSTLALARRPRIEDYIQVGASNLAECEGLDLLASHPDLRLVEREHARAAIKAAGMLTSLDKAQQKARAPIFEELQKLARRYDAVIVDCPPGVSLYVEAGVFSADAIICPTAPEPLATLGLETIVARFYRSEWLLSEMSALGRRTPSFRILFSRVGAGDPRHRAEIDRIVTLVEKLDWADDDIAVLDEEIETSPDLARAFEDPDLQRPYAARYGSFAARADDICGAILTDAARRS